MDLYARAAALLAERRPAVMVTVVDAAGSTPRKPGARMLVHAGGAIEGSIGGGRVEKEIIDAALRVLDTGSPELIEYQLTAQLAMCCGGRMTLFLEPLVSNPTLIVFGCGHVGAAVIRAAAPLRFDVVAVDDREDLASGERLPEAVRLVHSYEPADVAALPFGEDAYILIATRDHALDQKLLELCVRKPSRYLGVIGSPRKAKLQRERLAAKDVPAELIERVHCPVGLDIGAQTPEEIAVAVCAELVAARRGGARFSGRA